MPGKGRKVERVSNTVSNTTAQDGKGEAFAWSEWLRTWCCHRLDCGRGQAVSLLSLRLRMGPGCLLLLRSLSLAQCLTTVTDVCLCFPPPQTELLMAGAASSSSLMKRPFPGGENILSHLPLLSHTGSVSCVFFPPPHVLGRCGQGRAGARPSARTCTLSKDAQS